MATTKTAKRDQLNAIIAGFGLGDYDKLEAAKAKWSPHKPAAKADKTQVKANNIVEVQPAKPKFRDRVTKMFRAKEPKDLVDDFYNE